VKLDGRLYGRYNFERGVKQGSVLSPALFLLVLWILLGSFRLLRWVLLSTTYTLVVSSMLMISGPWLLVKHLYFSMLSYIVKEFADKNLLKRNANLNVKLCYSQINTLSLLQYVQSESMCIYYCYSSHKNSS